MGTCFSIYFHVSHFCIYIIISVFVNYAVKKGYKLLNISFFVHVNKARKFGMLIPKIAGTIMSPSVPKNLQIEDGYHKIN